MSTDAGRGPLGPVPPLPVDPSPKRKRRRRDRARADAPPSRPRARVARLWAMGIAIVAVVGLAAVGVLWARYRMAYVVSGNATVKGSMTNVGAQLSGVVTVVEVEAGQRVKAGQVLARFEDHQLQANVQRAESRLREATARSASARARIGAARSQTEEARARYDQRVPLAASGAIARDELRAAETRRRTTEALERTAVADERASEAEVATASAEVALAKADVAAAVIRSPADGWVVRRIAEPGASVVVGQPIVALWIGKEVWVEAWIDEDQLANVAVGNEAKITLKSFADRAFNGVVETIGISTDSELPEAAVPQPRNARMRTTPLVCVRIRLEETQGLFPGLSAVVAIRKKGA